MKILGMNKLGILLVAVFMLSAANTYGQRGQRGQGQGNGQYGDYQPRNQSAQYNNCRIADVLELTEDQTAKIEKIRLDAMKKTTVLQNQIREKRAKLISLQTADEVDMKAVNKLIDEIAALRAQIQKINAQKHQDIRSLLTDDQKVIFDKHFGNRGFGKARGNRSQRGGGNGNYPNCYRR